MRGVYPRKPVLAIAHAIARMRLVIGTLFVREIDVRIDLGRGHAFMTQKIFDRNQVYAVFKKMRGERMAQRVRCRMLLKAADLVYFSKNVPDVPRRKAASSNSHE